MRTADKRNYPTFLKFMVKNLKLFLVKHEVHYSYKKNME